MIAWENKLPLTNCQSIHAFSSIFTIDFPFKLDRINYFPTIRTVIVLEKSYHVTPPLLFNWSKFFFIFFNWNISTFVPWKNFHNSNKYSKISKEIYCNRKEHWKFGSNIRTNISLRVINSPSRPTPLQPPRYSLTTAPPPSQGRNNPYNRSIKRPAQTGCPPILWKSNVRRRE